MVMPEQNAKKAIEMFIDDLDIILFDPAEGDKLSDEEKVKRVKHLCAEIQLALVLEEVS
jgi:hypothetical protein